ncbi:MAG TPA: hypothetical protein VF468_14775 [Actinomycetota bacterium]|nr:hypothetical protein [Actinomycetota bacterium]
MATVDIGIVAEAPQALAWLGRGGRWRRPGSRTRATRTARRGQAQRRHLAGRLLARRRAHGGLGQRVPGGRRRPRRAALRAAPQRAQADRHPDLDGPHPPPHGHGATWQEGRLPASCGTWDHETEREAGVGLNLYTPGTGCCAMLLGQAVSSERPPPWLLLGEDDQPC